MNVSLKTSSLETEGGETIKLRVGGASLLHNLHVSFWLRPRSTSAYLTPVSMKRTDKSLHIQK